VCSSDRPAADPEPPRRGGISFTAIALVTMFLAILGCGGLMFAGVGSGVLFMADQEATGGSGASGGSSAGGSGGSSSGGSSGKSGGSSSGKSGGSSSGKSGGSSSGSSGGSSSGSSSGKAGKSGGKRPFGKGGAKRD
jgi:hypothetical protein